MPRPKGSDLTTRQFRLGPRDLARIGRIESALRGRGGPIPTATAAVRWALAELDARLASEELAAAAGGLTLTRPGPMIDPSSL